MGRWLACCAHQPFSAQGPVRGPRLARYSSHRVPTAGNTAQASHRLLAEWNGAQHPRLLAPACCHGPGQPAPVIGAHLSPRLLAHGHDGAQWGGSRAWGAPRRRQAQGGVAPGGL